MILNAGPTNHKRVYFEELEFGCYGFRSHCIEPNESGRSGGR